MELTEQLWNLLISKIDGFHKEYSDDKAELKKDRATCNEAHSKRMDELEGKFNTLDRVMLKQSAYTAGFVCAIGAVLKLIGVL